MKEEQNGKAEPVKAQNQWRPKIKTNQAKGESEPNLQQRSYSATTQNRENDKRGEGARTKTKGDCNDKSRFAALFMIEDELDV